MTHGVAQTPRAEHTHSEACSAQTECAATPRERKKVSTHSPLCAPKWVTATEVKQGKLCKKRRVVANESLWHRHEASSVTARPNDCDLASERTRQILGIDFKI